MTWTATLDARFAKLRLHSAAADAKARNRELVERNERLVQQQRRLETENAAMRELKNRAVVLSQENARLSVHANEAAGLRQRNSELEAKVAGLRADAAANKGKWTYARGGPKPDALAEGVVIEPRFAEQLRQAADEYRRRFASFFVMSEL